MDVRTNQPHSPSARFYANRQSEGPEMFDMFPNPDPEEQPRPQLIPPFSHFQGFSAPASSHRYTNNTYAACLSDERMSPRTKIPPHDHQTLELPGQRVEQLSDEISRMPSTGYNYYQHHVSGLVHTHEYHQELSGSGRVRQLSEPPTHTTPPPQYFSSPKHAPAPALAGRPASVMSRPRGTPAGPPVRDHVPGRNTIRVPSNSGVSDADQQPYRLATAGSRLAANENVEASPVSDDGDDETSTVYPHDGTTTRTSSSTASGAAHGGGALPRPLEDAVVEVHNTCLAATQRYLESLRINWELRHGREILTPPGLAGPTRRLRDRAGARGSPYSYSLPQRRAGRALSENSGLESVRGLRGGGDAGEEEVEEGRGARSQRRRQQPPACPIPAPTDSLLQNTSRICELVWRRARRDREDVLSAEAGGARRMALLVGCAEAVVLYDAAEWDRDPERGFYTACRAGREFCRELGDSLGVERVDGIEKGEL